MLTTSMPTDPSNSRPAGHRLPERAPGCPRAVEWPGVVLRRFQRAGACEVHLLASPSDPLAGIEEQAASAWRNLLAALRMEGLAASDLVQETAFLADAAASGAAAEQGRLRALAQARVDPALIASARTGQAPLGTRAAVQVAGVALGPAHDAAPASRVVVARPSACGCSACAGGLHGVLHRSGDESRLYAADIAGAGNDAYEQCLSAFGQAAAILADAGLSFRDVTRTWIRLADIDRDYDALNRARREFFASAGVRRRPASTGVEGQPVAPGHLVTLSLEAHATAAAASAPAMSTPTLNEAWTYGADFSRGLRLDDGGAVSLHVSGTASIDETGLTVHMGDFRAQAVRMLHNIETLLAEQGAGFADVVSAVAYLKRPDDAPALAAIFREKGFEGFPCAVVEAPLCRPELLCETEAVALRPLGSGA